MTEITPHDTERLNYRKVSNSIALGLLLMGVLNKEQPLLCKLVNSSCDVNLDRLTSYILIIVAALFISNLLQKAVNIKYADLGFSLTIKEKPELNTVNKVEIKIWNFIAVIPIVVLAAVALAYTQEIQNQLAYIMAIVFTLKSFKVKLQNKT